MAASESKPLVRFYELSGPKPWSSACWCTRFALNYIGVPYRTVKVSYPNIKPTCERLFADMTNIEPAAPLIEILYPRYEVINGSFSIAKLLVQKFPPEDGYKKLEGVDVIEQYLDEIPNIAQAILKYIVYDTYKNALDPYDGSKRHYKRKMEGMMKCKLSNVMANCREAEAAVLQEIRDAWLPLRERMKTEDENTEPTYKDFLDASLMKRVEAASPSKYRVLLMLYGDDTLTKLMGRVEKYSS